jgi:hypothetical protein
VALTTATITIVDRRNQHIGEEGRVLAVLRITEGELCQKNFQYTSNKILMDLI